LGPARRLRGCQTEQIVEPPLQRAGVVDRHLYDDPRDPELGVPREASVVEVVYEHGDVARRHPGVLPLATPCG
jgi:hypothetical protein